MGKVKIQDNLNVSLTFLLVTADQGSIESKIEVELVHGSLSYSMIEDHYHEFLESNRIHFETIMLMESYPTSDQPDLTHYFKPLNKDFQITFQDILELYGVKRFIVIVKRYVEYLEENFNAKYQKFDQQIGKLRFECMQLKEKIEELESSRNQKDSRVPSLNELPQLKPAVFKTCKSEAQNSFSEQLDICVLFSEPIYDESTNGPASYPVDFRSEIQRLKTALNSSNKPFIRFKCEIGTKENLRTCLRQRRPKILHIICHGAEKDGSLQFEDDSKTDVGALLVAKPEQIRDILKNSSFLPQLVFINSCHSEKMGLIFQELGVSNVVTINSADKIDDKAAQIFSESFYRNIFKCEKVSNCFKIAKDIVNEKNSTHNCCCHHASAEPHEADCRWINEIIKNGSNKDTAILHSIYHVPSDRCLCPQQARNSNRHQLKCEWARQSLFEINKLFRKANQNSGGSGSTERFLNNSEIQKYKYLEVCCCYHYDGQGNLITPHSQSHKFKILSKDADDDEITLFSSRSSIFGRAEIIDDTAEELKYSCCDDMFNDCVRGRQQELYEFMNNVVKKNNLLYILNGKPGSGRTTFSKKVGTYLVQRRLVQILFYVDTITIKEFDQFISQFYRVTRIKYPLDHNDQQFHSIRKKSLIIIFDNADQILSSILKQFLEFLNILRFSAKQWKFIITCRQETKFSIMNFNYEQKTLNLLRNYVATKILYEKTRKNLDITIEFTTISEIVGSNSQFLIPKFIDKFARSIANSSKKIKLKELKDRILKMIEADPRLIFDKKIEALKKQSEESYKLLIFLSQFWKGIQQKDLDLFSISNEKKSSIFDIPVNHDWKANVNILQTFQPIDIDFFQTPVLSDKKVSLVQPVLLPTESKVFKMDSEFIRRSGSRIFVEPSLHEHIWKNHKATYNLQTRHLFLAYLTVMLELYIQWLARQYHVHEQLLENSAISKSGFFSFDDNNLPQNRLTESTIQYNNINNEMKKLVNEHSILKDRIKQSDPENFITSHILDFLKIYAADWRQNYKELKKPTLINYLQKLAVLIPSALLLTNHTKQTNSSIQSAIIKSLNLVNSISGLSTPLRNVIVCVKLELMRATNDQIINNHSLISQIQHSKAISLKLDSITEFEKESVKENLKMEIEFLKMYQYWKVISEPRYEQISKKIEHNKKVQQVLNDFNDLKNQEFAFPAMQRLHKKRRFLNSLIYLQHLRGFKSFKQVITPGEKLKASESAIEFALDSAQFFKSHEMMKLCLHAYMTAVLIHFEKDKLEKQSSKRQEDESTQNQKQKKWTSLILKCIQIYESKTFHLSDSFEFDEPIKLLRKKIKPSANNIFFYKAFPMSSLLNPFIQNIVRVKDDIRSEVDDTFKKTPIDVCVRFEILNNKNLQELATQKCDILFLCTNTRINNEQKVCLIFEGAMLQEWEYDVKNQNFLNIVKEVELLVIIGQNADLALKAINSELKQNQRPTIVSVSNTPIDWKVNNPKDCFRQRFNIRALRKEFINSFIKFIIQNKNLGGENYNFAQKFRNSLQRGEDKVIISISDQKKKFFIHQKGAFKDVSPGYRRKHNLDMRDINNDIFFHRWNETRMMLTGLIANKLIVNLYGESNVGKSSFLEELARILIQRNIYKNGLYIIAGKDIEEHYKGDIQKYFNNSKIHQNGVWEMLHKKDQIKHFLLIIDDFHLIRTTTDNERFYELLIKKKIDLIFATAESYRKMIEQKTKRNNVFGEIAEVHLKSSISKIEYDAFACNYLDIEDRNLMVEYEKIRDSEQFMNITQIINWKHKYPKKRGEIDQPPVHKKMISNYL